MILDHCLLRFVRPYFDIYLLSCLNLVGILENLKHMALLIFLSLNFEILRLRPSKIIAIYY